MTYKFLELAVAAIPHNNKFIWQVLAQVSCLQYMSFNVLQLRVLQVLAPKAQLHAKHIANFSLFQDPTGSQATKTCPKIMCFPLMFSLFSGTFALVARPLFSAWSHAWVADYLNEFARLVCRVDQRRLRYYNNVYNRGVSAHWISSFLH